MSSNQYGLQNKKYAGQDVGPYSQGVSPPWQGGISESIQRAADEKKWWHDELQRYIQQHSGIAGGKIAGGTAERATSPSMEKIEYLVVVVYSDLAEPVTHRAGDAAAMQAIVDHARSTTKGAAEIVVFKRMIRMVAKVQWEPADVDL